MAPSLSDPVDLPCGLRLPNRLVKAALGEGLATSSHQPNLKFFEAYGQWGAGGWGGILTGNVMVDERHCGSSTDVLFEADPFKRPDEAWEAYAEAAQSHGTPGFVQINHPGRQSPVMGGRKWFWTKNMAPSAVPLNVGSGLLAWFLSAAIWGTPREMTIEEIRTTTQLFTDAACYVVERGFKGVQIHGAHGFLLAQFLSSKSNRRTDEYGGTPLKRARFAVEVTRAIRQAVPADVAVGIKFNSVDHQQEESLHDAIEQIRAIVDAGIDFLEISGGTYEDPQMLHARSAANIQSTKSSAREAHFLDFAREIRRSFPNLTLMLTGGFRTRAGMEAALADGACDLIGVGRPAVVNPAWPKEVLLNENMGNEEAQLLLNPVNIPSFAKKLGLNFVAAGSETVYYVMQIARIAKGLRPMAP
ncbi:NADH:flavin oxidoreductase/NADH oxidase [Eremomyces bilateralis CBS 781.70]|uniref:NADH:flavin oxidoreductase/NADH oxidase n=1 Tax=Eremomyces bilateralis CBS 781.70 TaxID=1392243 RepID=A0A6G1G3Q5_9PEZI|nr:NADH:flavin oxidoreductase/NADH oxidase [Eremomyces bilateralis CBS 781.70]KAF1812747.1 NADH:flavin oxidoreductase/NADH oxidase [Eremomyces bilateralis CBS 781.70]